MGNALYYCMVHQVPTVRVMKSEEEVVEFDKPIVAKQLMKLYPGHLVVHCTEMSRSSGLGHRSKVSMLRADETLQLGQTYCLLRMSNHKGKPRGSKNHSGEGYDEQQDQNDSGGFSLLPQLAALHQQQFSGPWKPHLDAIIESPLNTPSRVHSLTMLPLARQAGYVPGSAMSPLHGSSTLSPLHGSSTPKRAEVGASSLRTNSTEPES